MARICSQCKYYNASGEESNCPKCQVALQTTFLPPPGQAGSPLRDVAELEQPRRQVRSAHKEAAQLGQLLVWLMRHRLVFSLIIAPLLGSAGLLMGNGGGSVRDKYEQVEIGMTQSEVQDLLGGTRMRFGQRNFSYTTRMTSSGSIDLTWREKGAVIHIYFVGGEVVNKTQEGVY